MSMVQRLKDELTFGDVAVLSIVMKEGVCCKRHLQGTIQNDEWQLPDEQGLLTTLAQIVR